MTLRPLLVAVAATLAASLVGCASLMGGDAVSDPDGSQRMDRMRLITQGLSAYADARAGASPASSFAPGYTPRAPAGSSASARKCRDPEAVCQINDSRCIAERRALPLCRL